MKPFHRLKFVKRCKRGHTRTAENTRVGPRGYRVCLDCAAQNAWARKHPIQAAAGVRAPARVHEVAS